MQIIEYYDSDRQEHWLNQMKKSDWGAGQYLYELLSQNRYKEMTGSSSKVMMLVNGEELVSFCTYAEKDDIPSTTLTPWIGFVYTFPQYRGHRYMGILLDEIEKQAKNENVSAIYISTNHNELYEKYGYSFYQMMNDMEGESSRVYRKKLV